MSYELAIFNGDRVMIPMTLDGITLEWTRQGAPGKITFTVVKDEYLSFQEGSVVRLTVDDTIIFKGFVFEKSRDREQHIKVVAYDQLRYFKNKDTFKIKSQKASEFLKFVTEAFLLKPGDIEDTGFVIENHLADNKTIFDAVQDALDLTLINTGRMYVLFDDAGKICLRDCDKMQSDLLICSQTAENFDYSSSIDDETYNTFGGYFLNSSFLFLPSKKVSFRNIATFPPFSTSSSAFSTNSCAYLYGGLVMINPYFLL